jgi:hypothetical protein
MRVPYSRYQPRHSPLARAASHLNLGEVRFAWQFFSDLSMRRHNRHSIHSRSNVAGFPHTVLVPTIAKWKSRYRTVIIQYIQER